jgi:hypothetical protein
VHKDQSLRELLHHLQDIPLYNTCAFDAISKEDYALDTKMADLDEKVDMTRYVHFVVV